MSNSPAPTPQEPTEGRKHGRRKAKRSRQLPPRHEIIPWIRQLLLKPEIVQRIMKIPRAASWIWRIWSFFYTGHWPW